MSLREKYCRVGFDRTCPICGHDSWCLIARDGSHVLCMRVESRNPRRMKDMTAYRHGIRGDEIPPDLPQKPEQVYSLPVSEISRRVNAYKKQCGWGVKRNAARQLGVKPSSLERLNVGFNKGALTFPMYHRVAKLAGIRYRAFNGRKWTELGTGPGLFIPRNFRHEEVLFVVEGPTSTAVLLDLDLPVLGRSNRCGETESVLRYAQGKRTVIISDIDASGHGQRDAANLQALIPNSKVLSFPPYSDVREWYNSNSNESSEQLRQYLLGVAWGQ